ncbi:MAG TPA: DUF6285 domain-containing protein [Myxococcaceae bacterium]|nr:DUF6285 domain-containing protein [Myxococcaceae bacterium]
MLERPDEPALLEALAKFLIADLQPAVKDKKLAFRVLIASHLATTLANQLRGQAERQGAELQRLRELLGRSDGDVQSLNAALAEKLRSGPLSAEDFARASAALKHNLQDALAVVNPTFDTSLEIE